MNELRLSLSPRKYYQANFGSIRLRFGSSLMQSDRIHAIPQTHKNNGIKCSRKLTPKKNEKLFKWINCWKMVRRCVFPSIAHPFALALLTFFLRRSEIVKRMEVYYYHIYFSYKVQNDRKWCFCPMGWDRPSLS